VSGGDDAYGGEGRETNMHQHHKSSLGWFKPWVFLRGVFLNGLNGLNLFKQI
jgi:hypothetical protein